MKKDNEIKVKKISWKPKIGDRVDFSTDKGKYAAGTIISSQKIISVLQTIQKAERQFWISLKMRQHKECFL